MKRIRPSLAPFQRYDDHGLAKQDGEASDAKHREDRDVDPLSSDQEIDIKAKDEQKCRTDHVSRQIRCEIEEKSRFEFLKIIGIRQ